MPIVYVNMNTEIADDRLQDDRFGVAEDELLMKKIGRTIRTLRLSHAMTPGKFALQVGSSPWYVVKLEAGLVPPDLALLERCASALHIDISELLFMAMSNPNLVLTNHPGANSSN